MNILKEILLLFIHVTIIINLQIFTNLWREKSITSLFDLEHRHLVGPYYAGPNSTPAPLMPALITPRQNLGQPPLRAAFNATVRKIRKLKNNKEYNHQERLPLSQHLIYYILIRYSIRKTLFFIYFFFVLFQFCNNYVIVIRVVLILVFFIPRA